MHNKMLTDDNLIDCGCNIVSVLYSLYEGLLDFAFVVALRQWIGAKLHYVVDFSSLSTLLSHIPSGCSSLVSDFMLLVLSTRCKLFGWRTTFYNAVMILFLMWQRLKLIT